MRFASTVFPETRSHDRISLAQGIAETFEHERREYSANGIPS
jgi:hypothetical protein